MVNKKRHTYNISGLRNQQAKSSEVSSHQHAMELEADEDDTWQPHTFVDSLKIDFEAEVALDEENGDEECDVEEWDSEWKEEERMGSEGLQAVMMKLVMSRPGPAQKPWLGPGFRRPRLVESPSRAASPQGREPAPSRGPVYHRKVQQEA